MSIPIKVPASYQSDEGPKLTLRDMRTEFTGAGRSGFDWEKKTALARPGESRSAPEQIRLTLTLDVNAEAVRRIAAFFKLYGEDEEFRRRGYLPSEQVGPDAPRALPQEAGVLEGELLEDDDE